MDENIKKKLVLMLEGSQEEFEALQRLFASGDLSNLLNAKVVEL